MSESPEESGDTGRKNIKPTFRFCSDCSNLLYPKEDRQNNKLMYACRTCEYSRPAEHEMVSRKEVNSTAGDTAGLTVDIGQDLTVGDPDEEELPAFCTMCGQPIYCSICGAETDGGLCLEIDDDASALGDSMSFPEIDKVSNHQDYEHDYDMYSDPESSDEEMTTESAQVETTKKNETHPSQT